MLLQQQVAAIQQNRGVDGRLAASSLRRQRHARHHGGRQIACSRGQLIDRCAAAGQETRLFKKVGRRIAADDKFGENRQPRTLCGGAPAGGNDSFKISPEIPHRGIDLGQCDLHTSSLVP